MITRIMAVGRGRFIEAACSLSFDNNFGQKIDKTFVILPANKECFFETLTPYNIDTSKIEVVYDNEIINTHRLEKWQHKSWYLQQALKLALLDQIDAEYFLIQDCDLIPIQHYDLFINNAPHFRVQDMLCNKENEPYPMYARTENYIGKLITHKRPRNFVFVSEIMPVSKDLWISCREKIQNNCGLPWQEAIPYVHSLDDTQWFSEYELLGFYSSGHSPNQTYSFDWHPKISSWDDFYCSDWTKTATCKTGLARPLKFMSQDEGSRVIEHFKSLFKYQD